MDIFFMSQSARKFFPKVLTAIVLVFLASLIVCVKSYSMDEYDEEGSFLENDSAVVVINRSVNLQGLTGLIFTNSAFTQPAGHVVVGFSGLYENNDNPNESIVQGGGTLTMGITDRIEVGVKGKMIATNIGSKESRDVGNGDDSLLLKWRFSSQGEFFPALAFGLEWTFPTGDSKKGYSEVKYEGVKLMAIASSEKRVIDDVFVGVYFDAQWVLNDQYYGQGHNDGNITYKDKYGIADAGLLFPISSDNRMQFSLEYSRVFNKDIETLHELGYEGVTPGLRYVTDNFYISAGVQQMSIDYAGSPKNRRYVGTIGYRF